MVAAAILEGGSSSSSSSSSSCARSAAPHLPSSEALIDIGVELGMEPLPCERGCSWTCYECGAVFMDLERLRCHLEYKTAWSNTGLVACRVSCLIDCKEWQEGTVLQYEPDLMRHLVEFTNLAPAGAGSTSQPDLATQSTAAPRRTWLNMLDTAFYVTERPRRPFTGGEEEVKVPEGLEEDILETEERWTVSDGITLEFAAAQSMVHLAYGGRLQETGHKTEGHLCVTEEDKEFAKEARGSLLYGELLPRGVHKAMGDKHLRASSSKIIYDLGMGTGKVAMQVFLQFPNLQRVYGVELSQARYMIGERALFKLIDLNPGSFSVAAHRPGRLITLQERRGGRIRTLEFECGNLFECPRLEEADVVLLETDLPQDTHFRLAMFMRGLKKGCRALTYLNMCSLYLKVKSPGAAGGFPFSQVEVNLPLTDRFPTSWSVNRGHHFYLYEKDLPAEATPYSLDSASGSVRINSRGGSSHRIRHPIFRRKWHGKKLPQELPSCTLC